MNKCQRCGQNYGIDLNIPDELWRMISPNHDESGLLCGSCIMYKLEGVCGYSAFQLINIKDLQNRFNSIINGQGALVPRVAIKIAIEDILEMKCENQKLSI